LTTQPAAGRAGGRAARIENEPFVRIGRPSGFVSGTISSIRDIWSQRELLGLLSRREIVSRYKNSSLGIIWSLARPLVQLLIYWFAIGIILGAQRTVPDFAIFVFIGLSMWSLFTDIVTYSVTSITANSGIVKKVSLPTEVFPLSTVGVALLNFAAQLVVLFAAMLVFGRFPLTADLLYAPLALILIIIYATAIGLLIAGLNVYFRDTEHLIEVVLVVLFWASPIVYSFTYVHQALDGSWIEQLYLANPATIAIVGMQQALWVGGVTATGPLAQVFPDDLAIRMLVMLGISLVLLWLAQRIFGRLSRNFAQEL